MERYGKDVLRSGTRKESASMINLDAFMMLIGFLVSTGVVYYVLMKEDVTQRQIDWIFRIVVITNGIIVGWFLLPLLFRK